jgi:dienelactone hydrolase
VSGGAAGEGGLGIGGTVAGGGAGGGLGGGNGSGGAAGVGGATGSGGVQGMGGATDAGRSGAAGSGAAGGGGNTTGRDATGAGGAAGTGGTASVGDAGLTAGCNATTWPMGGTGNEQTISVTNNGVTAARQFFFVLPANYVSSRPYRLIFAWHYLGGMASTIAGNGAVAAGGRYYGVGPILTDSFFVAPQGLLDQNGNAGFPNTNDQDVAFARAMIDWMSTNFCIDKTRLFSMGFSFGAMMSHTLACEMPDTFRAIGVESGILTQPARNCVNRPIAAWITHGTADAQLPFTSGEAARDRIVGTNHCAMTTQPVTPSPCVAYDGCDSGFPVTWCPVQDGTHQIQNFAAQAIADFFRQF